MCGLTVLKELNDFRSELLEANCDYCHIGRLQEIINKLEDGLKAGGEYITEPEK